MHRPNIRPSESQKEEIYHECNRTEQDRSWPSGRFIRVVGPRNRAPSGHRGRSPCGERRRLSSQVQADDRGCGGRNRRRNRQCRARTARRSGAPSDRARAASPGAVPPCRYRYRAERRRASGRRHDRRTPEPHVGWRTAPATAVGVRRRQSRTSTPTCVPEAPHGREDGDGSVGSCHNARAPVGARAEERHQARAAIASTSFHFGKRPVAFLEYTSSPSRVISNTPPEPFTSSMSASSIWENLSLTRSASGSYPQAPQYSILNFIESSPAVPSLRGASIHPHPSMGHLTAEV